LPLDHARIETEALRVRQSAARRWTTARVKGWSVSRRALLVPLLLASDLLGVLASFFLAYAFRRIMPGLPPLAHGFDVYLAAGPALVVWGLMFWQQGLYPGLWLTAREELRRIAAATTTASLLAMALTFVTRTELLYSRPIVVGSWLMSLLLVPGIRYLTRKLATRMGFSGPPAVVLGAGEEAAAVLGMIRWQQPPALTPVAAFDDDPAALGNQLAGIEVVGPLEQAASWALDHGIDAAIIALPAMPAAQLIPLIRKQTMVTPRTVIVSNLFGISGADLIAHDLQGVVAVELRNNLLSRNSLRVKRAIDLLLLVTTAVVTVPLAGIIALAVSLESGRPVIFGHPRIGKMGKPFTAWKFRSMVLEAGELLQEAVASRPAVREEWESRQKLREDPRLTRVGRILRRTSLDELPQLWNVLAGDMSLVGPRPIVAEETARYGEALSLYVRVPPGLTGLWQISGRSDTTYAERVRLDTYYVHSWSVWMDLVILVRTGWIVLTGSGAY
jgi:Undecaprenyl-phosphate galactose phosphotransferase WbaP